jgi:hypothetical protein
MANWMNLTAGQLTALRNLARKKAGEPVDWIKISDARALTDLGLAERNREGWTITAAGESLLADQAVSSDAAELDSAPVLATIRPALVVDLAPPADGKNPLD